MADFETKRTSNEHVDVVHFYHGTIPARLASVTAIKPLGHLRSTAAMVALSATIFLSSGAIAAPSHDENPQSGGLEIAEAAPEAAPPKAANDDPDLDPEKLLESVQNDATRNARSFERFDTALGNRQIFSDLRTLQESITDSQRPVLNVATKLSTQSDDIDIFQAEVSQDIFFLEGRSQVRFAVQSLKYTPEIGTGVSQLVAGLTGRHTISDLAAVTGELWFNRVKFGARTEEIVTYDVFLTLRPSDFVRIDIDTSRRTFDNIRSLQMGITAESIGGSIDFLPSDTIRLTLRGAGGFYSDGNKRQSGEAEAIWRVTGRPVIEVGARGTYFHFSRLLNNGYFNPDNYASGEAMFRLQSPLSKKLDVELTASGGIEHSDPGGSKPLIKASFQMTYKVAKNWTLDGGVSYFSSRESNSSGFSRTSAMVSLHYRF